MDGDQHGGLKAAPDAAPGFVQVDLIAAALDGFVTMKEPLTAMNCTQVLREMAGEMARLARQNIALRNALKEAL